MRIWTFIFLFFALGTTAPGAADLPFIGKWKTDPARVN
jgi:hypothetical protein